MHYKTLAFHVAPYTMIFECETLCCKQASTRFSSQRFKKTSVTIREKDLFLILSCSSNKSTQYLKVISNFLNN